jgi:hypothetical protein
MIESRPKVTVEDSKETKQEFWCSGRTVMLSPEYFPEGDFTKSLPVPLFNVHPITLKVDSFDCSHEDGECTRASAALHALYVLGATGIISRDIANKIHFSGWARVLNEEEKAGRNTRKCILGCRPMAHLLHLWQPHQALDFLYWQEEQDRMDFEGADGANKQYLEEFHRIKCYYRTVGDGKLMFLKKKRGCVSFDMEEVPEVIERMTKLWTVTGGNPDALLSIAVRNCEGATTFPTVKPPAQLPKYHDGLAAPPLTRESEGTSQGAPLYSPHQMIAPVEIAAMDLLINDQQSTWMDGWINFNANDGGLHYLYVASWY